MAFKSLHRSSDDVPTEEVLYITSQDALERIRVAGYNEKVDGKYVRLMPRISRRDYADLRATQLPDADGTLETMLDSMPHMEAEVRAKFLTSHRAVVDAQSGRDIVYVVPRVAAVRDEEDEPAAEMKIVDVDVSGRAIKKKYQLSQFFSDPALYDKYNMSARQMNTIQRTAATKPVAAAKCLQSALNLCQTDVAVTVVAGDLVRDRGQAKNTVRMLTRSYPLASASVLSAVIGDQLWMFGPDGYEDWHVRGPLDSAWAVRDIYNMVNSEGCQVPSFLLSLELAMLSIDIYDGSSYAATTMSYHMALGGQQIPEGSAVSGLGNEDITAEQRVKIHTMTDRVLALTDSSGDQIASAVRVTEKHVLLNAHVMSSTGRSVVGGRDVALHRQFGRDIWSALSDGELRESWAMRAPRRGELVVVCYRRGDVVDFSEPIQVISVDGDTIVLSLSSTVSAGVSGGAVVALQDMALLGIHSGTTMNNLIACVFGQQQFSDLLEDESVSSVSRYTDNDTFASDMYTQFANVGLGPSLRTIMGAVVPVFLDNRHVGSAAYYGGGLCTTCDPEMPLRVGTERRPCVFKQDGVAQVYVTELFPEVAALSQPTFRRAPEYYEKVFVVGADEKGTYFSRKTTVQHIGLNARSFILADVPGASAPLLGGLVVGSDSAVLGICGARSMSTAVGIGFVCWALPVVDKPVLNNDPTVVLTRAFPFLNVAAWPEGVLEEVFTHSSVGRYVGDRSFNKGQLPLANVGDNAAKAELYASLRAKLVPHSEWALLMQKYQSNAAYAKIAHSFRFASCMALGKGVQFVPSGKAYADLTEALLGACYLYEQRENFVRFCEVLGLLGGTSTVVDSD